MKKLIILIPAFFLGVSLLIIGLISLFLLLLPDVEKMKGCLTTELYKVKLCPKSNQYVRLSHISKFVRVAIISAEDTRFYIHQGFDFEEIFNSFEINMKKGRWARGGSTITQQLAKNVFLTKEKTIWRKIKEAVLTMQIEKNFKKNEILEKYLNVVQFGKGIWGIRSAAEQYFSKDPMNLTLFESAFLAHLMPNPEVYARSFLSGKLSSFSNKRIRQILNFLYKYNKVTEDEYLQATSQLDSFGEDPIQIDEEILSEEELSDDQILENQEGFIEEPPAASKESSF